MGHHTRCDATARVRRRYGLLNHEVSPHLEGLARSGALVDDGDRHRVLVGGHAAQTAHNVRTAVEIVAVDDDGVKVFTQKDFRAGVWSDANFDSDRVSLEGAAQRLDQLRISTD